MKISACYIAKNEEENIISSLESIKEIADELILVDTGSTDKTKEIFESYGGIVYKLPWSDDFSDPRNLALSKASGDWLILLDADEYFSNETKKNIRCIIEENIECDAFMVNITNIDRKNNGIKDCFYNIRIAKNQKKLCYNGRIHEYLALGNEPLTNIRRIDKGLLNIIHTGYSSELTIEKSVRNLQILQTEIANGRSEGECYTYLAECYDGIGDVVNMLKYAWLDILQGRRAVSYASRSYRKLMNYYANNGSVDERFSLVQKAVEDFPELPEFHAELSSCYAQMNNLEEAVVELEMAINLYKEYNDIEPCLLDDEDCKFMENNLLKLQQFCESNGINISACLICKNEADNIENWIKNVKEFADEIIIIDTGSEDATTQIVEKCGERCYNYKWTESFAEAKNYAIEKARGKWIVFTDADEFFYYPNNVKAFLQDVDNDNSDIDAIMVPISNVDEVLNDVEISRFNGIRIFRSKDTIRYFGNVHEALSDISAPGDVASLKVMVAGKELLIRHTGYSSNKMQAKLYRNKELIQQDIRKNGLHERHYRYLAEIYYGLGDYIQALKFSLLAIESDIQAIGQLGDMYWVAINALEELNYSREERKALLENAMSVCSDIPDFYGLYGLFTLKNDAAAAKQYLDRALSIYEEKDTSASSTNFQQILDKVYTGLGKYYGSQGDKKMSMEYYLKALQVNKWQDDAIIGLADLFDCQPKQELLKILQDVYNYDNDVQVKRILSKIFDNNGAVDLAKVFDTKEIKEYNFLREGNYDAMMRNLPADMVYSMQVVFIGLLCKDLNMADYTARKQLELLPGNLKQIVLGYHIEIERGKLTEDMFEEYHSMLTVIMLQPIQVVKEHYLKMAECFSQEAIAQVISVAVENEQWNVGLYLCQHILADSSVADGEFWSRAGKCLYNLKNIPAAEECFEKAVDLLYGDNKNEAAAYLAWCQEALA